MNFLFVILSHKYFHFLLADPSPILNRFKILIRYLNLINYLPFCIGLEY